MQRARYCINRMKHQTHYNRMRGRSGAPQETRRLPKKMKKRVFKSGLFDVKNPWAQSEEPSEEGEDDGEWELPLPDDIDAGGTNGMKTPKEPGGPPPDADAAPSYWGFGRA